MTNQKILIVEDETIVALDIEQMLIKKGYQVTGIASGTNSALKLFYKEIPDLILCDIHLRSKQSGISLVKEIRKSISVPVIYITAYSDEKSVKEAFDTKPDSYLTKPFTEEQLMVSIRLVLNRKTPNEFDIGKPTNREMDIIACIVTGMTSKEIAKKLVISFETVQSHRKNILSKYKIKSSAELVGLALKNKWV